MLSNRTLLYEAFSFIESSYGLIERTVFYRAYIHQTSYTACICSYRKNIQVLIYSAYRFLYNVCGINISEDFLSLLAFLIHCCFVLKDVLKMVLAILHSDDPRRLAAGIRVPLSTWEGRLAAWGSP